MKDASSPAIAPNAAPSAGLSGLPNSPNLLHYVLEAEWPHRAVPTTARQRCDAARDCARARAAEQPERSDKPAID